MTCTASGGSVVLAPAGSGRFDVEFAARPTKIGPQINPGPSGVCMVDPDAIVAEATATANNRCRDTVMVVAPALLAVKRNNVNGQVQIGSPWTWTIRVANIGTLPAAFTDGQRIVVDDLPETGVTYGTPTITFVANNVTNSENIDCAIVAFELSCVARGATVTMAEPSSFDVAFTVTPVAGGVVTNPRAGGVCAVDPDGLLVEGDETNNGCADSVTVLQPDLTARVFSAPSPIPVGEVFYSWILRVANEGDGTATFAKGQRIVFSDLPTNLTFNGSVMGNTDNVDTQNIGCGVSQGVVGCSANGPVSLPAGSSFELLFFPNLGTEPTTYLVPPAGGRCTVDPDAVVPDRNVANNTCGATISLVLPSDMRVTSTNDVAGAAFVGDSWTWRVNVRNAGPGAATFADGQRILADFLPTGVDD